MPSINRIIDRLRPKSYGRKEPLILVNGLAEQAESWYKNRRAWSRSFDVHMPNFLVYSGSALHAKIEAKEPISVEYLVSQLHTYVTQFVQDPPYHIVASSLGGKIAVEFAVQYPELVNRLVLLCPSGMGDKEQLPIMEGVKASDWNAVVGSVFHRRRFVDVGLVRYYQQAMANRKWKTGMLRTIRGTLEHTVRGKLKDIQAETLFVTGARDRICCPKTAASAAKELRHGHFLSIPKCGHAPQIEKARLVNRLVTQFLTVADPSESPGWKKLLLAQPTRVKR
ncbi:alpha/beta fold hydrolase [soil metagenome]